MEESERWNESREAEADTEGEQTQVVDPDRTAPPRVRTMTLTGRPHHAPAAAEVASLSQEYYLISQNQPNSLL